MMLTPAGKWYWIKFDPLGERIVTLPMGEEQPNTGVVLAAGAKCEFAQVGQRIVFHKNGAQEITVDGGKLAVVHEDQVLGVLVEETPGLAGALAPARPRPRR